MGLYDSLIVNCPGCGDEIEFQSKAGECVLRRFTTDNAPDVIVADLNGERQECDCGHIVWIESKTTLKVS